MCRHKRAIHDDELKNDATEKLARFGLTISDAVRILLTRITKEGGLPVGLTADPEAAQCVKDDIEAKAEKLPDFPKMGRPGRVEGTRELVRLSTTLAHQMTIVQSTTAPLQVQHSAHLKNLGFSVRLALTCSAQHPFRQFYNDSNSEPEPPFAFLASGLVMYLIFRKQTHSQQSRTTLTV